MKRRRFLIVTIVGLLAIIWFAAVDWSWFIHQCDDCLYEADVFQVRLLTLPVYERSRPRHSAIELASIDLGIPCEHRGLRSWHKHKWWGLTFCACPCINGITSMMGDDAWYNANVAAKVKALGTRDTGLGSEFRQRVLVDHDWEYWRRFAETLEPN